MKRKRVCAIDLESSTRVAGQSTCPFLGLQVRSVEQVPLSFADSGQVRTGSGRLRAPNTLAWLAPAEQAVLSRLRETRDRALF